MKMNIKYKVSMKPENNTFALINQYFDIKDLVLKITKQKDKMLYSRKEVLQICEKMPKILERNINLRNEIGLFEQTKALASLFLSNKMKKQQKPYKLYLLFKNIVNSLSKRIEGHIQENFKLKSSDNILQLQLFLKELEQLNIHVYDWAKRTKYHKSIKDQAIYLVFPQDQEKTNRKTQLITANMTRNPSKYQKQEHKQTFSLTNILHNTLFRSSTAKLSRKKKENHVRFPSSNQNIVQKKSGIENRPIFSAKESSKNRFMHKSQPLESQQTQKQVDLQSFIEQINENTVTRLKNQRQSKMVLSSSRYSRKSSRISVFSSDSQNKIGQNKKQRSRNKNSIFSRGTQKKKTTLNKSKSTLNIEEKQIQQNQWLLEQMKQKYAQQQKKLQQEQLAARSNKRKTIRIIIPEQQLRSDSSIQNQTGYQGHGKRIYFASKKVYKNPSRRDGKVLRRQSQAINLELNEYEQNTKQIRSKTKRVTFVPYSQNESSIHPQIKSNFNKKKKQIKKDQYNTIYRSDYKQVAMLPNQDEIVRSKAKIDTEDYSQKNKQHRLSIDAIYGELQQFSKQFQKINAFKSQKSVFFEQQQNMKEVNDFMLKEKIQQLMISNKNNSNIFELITKYENNKEECYNRFSRNQCFQNDSQWIKHTFTPKEILAQTTF